MATCKCCGTTLQKVVPGCTLCGACEFRTFNTVIDMGHAELKALQLLVLRLQRIELDKLRDRLYGSLVMDDGKVEVMLNEVKTRSTQCA